MTNQTSLPQLAGDLYLTDGGLELHLIYDKGLELPHFAAYPLLAAKEGLDLLADYYTAFIRGAAERNVGLIVETPTWRANHDWGQLLGHDGVTLDRLNQRAVEWLRSLTKDLGCPAVVSGCMGPRGDGYQPGNALSPEEAQEYHTSQLTSFARARADQASAMTLTGSAEALGIALAARRLELPVVISFTVETDGRLPSGETLVEAVSAVEKGSENYPAYYMVNCAHPTHLAPALSGEIGVLSRMRVVKPNASRKSHTELETSASIDRGDPEDLARHCVELKKTLPQLNVFGGCCGTGVRHFLEMAGHLK